MSELEIFADSKRWNLRSEITLTRDEVYREKEFPVL